MIFLSAILPFCKFAHLPRFKTTTRIYKKQQQKTIPNLFLIFVPFSDCASPTIEKKRCSGPITVLYYLRTHTKPQQTTID